MKKLRKTIGIAAAAGLLCAAGAAHAGTVTLNTSFSPTPIATFDWSPGSVYTSTVPGNLSGFPVYFQAGLGSFQDSGGQVITGTGLNSTYWINLVAGYHENAVASASGVNSIASFSGNGAATTNGINSYTTIWLSNQAPDVLTGKGFTPNNPNNGAQTFTQLLTATVLPSTVSGVFQSNALQTGITTLLDNHGIDNWSGQKSVTGQGGTSLTAQVDTYNSTFFLDPINLSLMLFQLPTATQNNDPFFQVDPSQSIYDGFFNAEITTVGTLGTVNGSNIDGSGKILFQSDASTSFVVQPVPEPSTFVLSGLGVLIAGAFARRRRN